MNTLAIGPGNTTCSSQQSCVTFTVQLTHYYTEVYEAVVDFGLLSFLGLVGGTLFLIYIHQQCCVHMTARMVREADALAQQAGQPVNNNNTVIGQPVSNRHANATPATPSRAVPIDEDIHSGHDIRAPFGRTNAYVQLNDGDMSDNEPTAAPNTTATPPPPPITTTITTTAATAITTTTSDSNATEQRTSTMDTAALRAAVAEAAAARFAAARAAQSNTNINS